MAKRITGFILLITGIGIIFWTLYSSYNIFTVRAEAPQFFEMTAEEAVVSEKIENQGLESQFESIIEEQLKNILPLGSVPKFLNLVIWSILAGILILCILFPIKS